MTGKPCWTNSYTCGPVIKKHRLWSMVAFLRDLVFSSRNHQSLLAWPKQLGKTSECGQISGATLQFLTMISRHPHSPHILMGCWKLSEDLRHLGDLIAVCKVGNHHHHYQPTDLATSSGCFWKCIPSRWISRFKVTFITWMITWGPPIVGPPFWLLIHQTLLATRSMNHRFNGCFWSISPVMKWKGVNTLIVSWCIL